MTSRTLSNEKIIETTLILLREQKPVTFSNLGKRLGTRSQSLYNYFSGTTELKAAVTADYYSRIFAKLQTNLMGVAGEEAVVIFAKTYADHGIEDFFVTQYVMSLPKGKFHEDKQVKEAIESVYHTLQRLLRPMVKDEKRLMIVERMIRNLILGEIIHIGTGRFNNPLVDPNESFEEMLKIAIASIDEKNEN